MVFTEACRKSCKTSFSFSIAIDASYCSFFIVVTSVLSLLKECIRMTAAIAILLIISHSTTPLCYHYLNSNVPRPFLRPNKIKWRIKGRLRQTSFLCVFIRKIHLTSQKVSFLIGSLVSIIEVVHELSDVLLLVRVRLTSPRMEQRQRDQQS